MKVRNLIFDLDETLVALPVNWSEVYEELSKLLGWRVSSFSRLLPEVWGSTLYLRVSELVERYEMRALPRLTVLDDSPNVLRRLSKSHTLSLVTLQSRKVLERALKMMGIRELFHATVSREDKPTRREQIKLLLSTQDYKPSETLMVGNRLNDVTSALENKCMAALVVRGKSELKKLRKLKPEKSVLILRDLRELPERLLKPL